jgi:hypothetical protein
MAYIFAAREPQEGQTVLAMCWTRADAAQQLARFRERGLREIVAIDSAGRKLDERDLFDRGDEEAGDSQD